MTDFLPIWSTKSKQLQSALGVTSKRSAERKLIDLGCTIIDGQYISTTELQTILERKLRRAPAIDQSVVETSSFKDFQ